MTKRMTEARAIEILEKVKEFYSLKRQGYDEVIKWLRRLEKKRVKGESKKET